MRSQVRLRLAEIIRGNLDEFAERWVRFIRANDLAPDNDKPFDETVLSARLGFEVLANLLEDAEYSRFENVINRLLYDWINRAASYSDLLSLEEAFPLFIMPHLGIEVETDEEQEFIEALDEFFHSYIRAYFLSQYLAVYEEIITAESRHTAYVLAHFDAILALTAHLNAAETRDEIIDGLAPVMQSLFEHVLGVAVWTETPEGLKPTSIDLLDEEVPTSMLDTPLPERIEEVFNTGEVRWIPDSDLPSEFRSLIEFDSRSGLSGCSIPVRPKEADGVFILLAVGAENPGTLELSLSRVASAECALALDRVNGRARISRMNRRIRDILSLTRETSWGTGHHETSEMVIDYLLELVGGRKAILFSTTTATIRAEPATPIAWRDIPVDILDYYRKGTRLSPVVSIAARGRKPQLLTNERLREILRDKNPPPGFEPNENEALGILPLERKGALEGVCIYLCPAKLADESGLNNILALFARTAADSLATARQYERSLRMTRMADAETARARILQRQLTPRYARTGNIIYWAHLQPAGELAGDVLVVRNPSDGRLNVWVADVAGRGASAGWSMMFIRQLLTELPPDIDRPMNSLIEINSRLHEIESVTPPGIFATLIGLSIDEQSHTARFSRAGAPRLIKADSNGTVEVIDPEGMPLGLFDDPLLKETEFSFEPGDKLVWASDGLLGVMNEDGDRWSETGLVECVKESCSLPPRALYEQILSAVGEFAADEHARDDWSLVVIGHCLPPDWMSRRPGAERDLLLDEAVEWVESLGCGERDCKAIRLLLSEAIRNAHEHGNRLDDNGMIELKLTHSPTFIHVRIRDEGGKLNERVTSTELRPEKILEDKGRGFLLMRHQCDHLWVEEDRGELNAVRLLED